MPSISVRALSDVPRAAKLADGEGPAVGGGGQEGTAGAAAEAMAGEAPASAVEEVRRSALGGTFVRPAEVVDPRHRQSTAASDAAIVRPAAALAARRGCHALTASAP